MVSEVRRLAENLADELGVMTVSVTPDWSDEPTYWAGVDRKDWARRVDVEAFRVCESLEPGKVAEVVVHGVTCEVADIDAEFPDVVAWVRYAVMAFA
jgi:hypothetical protein